MNINRLERPFAQYTTPKLASVRNDLGSELDARPMGIFRNFTVNTPNAIVRVADRGKTKHLADGRHLSLPTLDESRIPRTQWPKIGPNGHEFERGEKIMVFGGHDLWRLPHNIPETATVDALYRACPVNLWEHISQAVLGHMTQC